LALYLQTYKKNGSVYFAIRMAVAKGLVERK